jgi:hypothetical protein
MKVAGEAVLHAPVEEVWTALNDANVLVRTIPGCERLEETGADAYRMTVTAGVASIKGSYDGEVRITDQQQPASFMLRASGSGAPGTVSADVLVTLDDAGDGSTRLRYDADAVVGGMIGGVGQRVLSGVAKKTAGEFFRNVDAVLADAPLTTVGTPAGADAGQQASVGTGSPRTALVQSGGQTFSRPAAATGSSDDFVKGAVFGAVVALLGALVGGLVARRRG